jgi:hypothetical protein
MKNYKINYYFDGRGEAFVEAKNEEEARDKFFGGEVDFESENEWGDTYNIETVEEIK